MLADQVTKRRKIEQCNTMRTLEPKYRYKNHKDSRTLQDDCTLKLLFEWIAICFSGTVTSDLNPENYYTWITKMTDNRSAQPQQKEPTLAERSLWQHHYDLFYKQDHELDLAPYLFVLAIAAVSTITFFFTAPQKHNPTKAEAHASAIELLATPNQAPVLQNTETCKNCHAPLKTDMPNFERSLHTPHAPKAEDQPRVTTKSRLIL